MESRKSAVEGNANHKAKTPLTFTHSINYLIYASAILGFNLKPGQKYRLISHILFANNLLIAIYIVFLSFRKYPCSWDDLDAIVHVVSRQLDSIEYLIFTVFIRWQIYHLQAIFQGIENILARFEDEGRPLLTKLNKIKLSVLFVFFMAFRTANRADAHVLPAHGHRNQTDHEQPEQALPTFNCESIFTFWVYSIHYLGLCVPNLIYLSIASATIFILLRFTDGTKMRHTQLIETSQCGAPFNDLLQYVSIHREIRQVFRLVDQIFVPLNLIAIQRAMLFLIGFGRVVVVPGKQIPTIFILGTAWLCCWTCFFTFVITFSKSKWKVSLRQLMEMGLQLKAERKLSPEEASALMTKLDLYVTYMQMDEHGEVQASLMSIKTPIIVTIGGVILSSTAYLYGI